jgi:antagonist of KipI
MSFVHVVRSGLQTTIQDRGRWGWQARGVPVAGPMDPDSCRVANALVGNAPGAALFEIAFVGPELEFADRRLVAAAGAEFMMSVDGRSAPMFAAFPVAAGSRVAFGERRYGARTYLAIAGGVAVPDVLGSRSTHLVSRMGGLGGRALAAGDRVPLGAVEQTATTPARLSAVDFFKARIRSGATADRRTTARVRVMVDDQLDRFAAGALEALQSGPYTVGPQSDRMGFRLQGPTLHTLGSADRLSDVTPLGTLQVPASGEPILLMADRQTTGGYARLATVISADVGLAGQLGPGDRLAFEVCSLQDSLAARIVVERALMAVEDAVRA